MSPADYSSPTWDTEDRRREEPPHGEPRDMTPDVKIEVDEDGSCCRLAELASMVGFQCRSVGFGRVHSTRAIRLALKSRSATS